jgi:type III pantothenate kinase
MDGRFGIMDKILLADIGNTHFHIYDGVKVVHLSYADAIEKYGDKKLYYISVKHQLEVEIETIKKWKNISKFITIEGQYSTMAVDRKALCLSYKSGLFIDAGSAITVDMVEDSVYEGGFLLPGLQAYVESYKGISTALETTLDKSVDLTTLATTTKEQISYGIIASIKILIDKHSKGKTLYFTGGDGEFLSTLFANAIYDETLVFQGIVKPIKDKMIC